MKNYLLLLLLASFSVEAQIVNIPDSNFKAKLLEANDSNEIAFSETLDFIKIDINENGEIEEEEAAQVYGLNVMNSNITSLVGLEFFINLRDLACSYNPITSLDLSSFDFFSTLICDNTLVENVELSFEFNEGPYYNGNISFINNPNLTNLGLNNISSSFEVFIKDNQSLINLEINVGENIFYLEISNNVNLTNLSINNINNGVVNDFRIRDNNNLDTLNFNS